MRRPLALLDIPGRVRSAVELPASSAVEFMKLQIWRLTEFDKLIWLDPDSVLVRSVDWLFQTRPPQASFGERECSPSEMDPESHIACVWMGLLRVALHSGVGATQYTHRPTHTHIADVEG